jgi:hypothetical protein
MSSGIMAVRDVVFAVAFLVIDKWGFRAIAKMVKA